MSKLTRKYGKKFVNFKALAVATMAGIASLGATNSVMAQDAGVIEPLSYGSGAIVEKFNFVFDEENNEKYLEYTTDDSADVTIMYDDSSSKVYDFEYKDYSSDAGTITSGSNSSNSPTELGSAGVVNPPSVSNVIFENNFSSGTVKYQSGGTLYGALSGGALYNDDSIESIAADFIDNAISITAESTKSGYSMYSSAEGRGGAIANYGEIQNLSGTFAYNVVTASSNANSAYVDAKGGAIYNEGLINSISGNFLFNTVQVLNRGSSSGGAIYNAKGAVIDSINANFIGNGSSDSYISGVAIYNDTAYIGSIAGDFVANNGYSVINNSNNWGSNSKAYIKDIKANFYENMSESVIYNNGVIESITGDFINNTGTAIENRGTIYKGISGNFIGNATAISDDGGEYVGTVKGYFANHVNNAIFGNLTKVMHIQDSVFENNTHRYQGGAVNLVSVGQPASLEPEDASTFPEDVDLGVSITNSVFNNNYIDSENSGMGGAIYNDVNNLTISNVEFNNNYVRTTGEEPYYYNDGSYGGAIYNDYNGAIANIQANFNGNYVESLSSSAKGGAIYNDGQVANVIYYSRYNITDSNGNITNVIYKFYDYTEEQFNKNKKDAIFLERWNTTYTFEDYLSHRSNYENCTTLEETLAEDLTWNEYSTMEDVPSLTNPYASGIVNSNFVNNYAISENGVAQGGAIYTSKDLNIITKDGYNSLISGNYVEDSEGKRPEAIHVANNILEGEYVTYAYVNNGTRGYSIYEDKAEATTLRLINTTNGKIKIDDQIVGQVDEMINGKYYWIYGNDGSSRQQYVNDLYYDIDTPTDITIVKSKLEILGDDTGLVQLNNDVKNLDILLANSNIHLGNRDNVLDNNNFFALAGSLSMINNQAGLSDLAGFGLIDKLDFYADVDLENETMDRISAGEYYVDEDAVFNVAGMNMLSDMKPGVDRLDIMFAEDGLKDNVIYQASELPHADVQTEIYTPIYKYNVAYDNREDAGYFTFLRGDKILTEGGGSSSTGNPSDAFNPAVLGSSSAASVGATATMNQAFNYAFQHSADYMNIPYLERVSMRDRNKYALSITGDATDMGRFSPLYQPSDEGASVWVKPYATFETVGLKNGPKVHNNTYGTLIGFDTEMQQLRRGWDRVFTGYIGYNGASQRYSGIDSTQNGGLLGGTMTLYKGNFFNATTVSVGASVANNQTMYGNEDFAMLLSGIGNKTGYNFEFKEGKLILQPSMLMSYTFVNTFDYTNAAGVRIDNKPLHALQLAPGVKVIGNLKGGWQPYASVQMVWNLMGESNATANGVKLPEMSIKPYVQYGLGVQKRIKDHFTAYGQAMVQNGGRNGVSLTAGFRWALGHDNCKYKVEAKQLRGKAAKSKCHSELDSESINANKTLSPTLSVGEGAKNEILRSAQNDGSRKILKQMTPEQKMAHGGKYYNTSRTAKTGSLRQY